MGIGYYATISLLTRGMLDRRRIPRTLVSKRAEIAAGQSLRACVVCDISSLGARLTLANNAPIPGIFDLTFDAARTLRKCRVAWRSEDQVGVEFQ